MGAEDPGTCCFKRANSHHDDSPHSEQVKELLVYFRRFTEGSIVKWNLQYVTSITSGSSSEDHCMQAVVPGPETAVTSSVLEHTFSLGRSVNS